MPYTQPPVRNTDLSRRVVRAIFRFRWSAIGFFLVFFLVLMVVGYTFPAIYEARATLLVKQGRENLPAAVSASTVEVGAESTIEDIVSEIEIMRSRPVLEAASERLLATHEDLEVSEGLGRKLKLSPPLSRKERVVQMLESGMLIELVTGTHVIEVLYKSKDAEVARDTVNFLVDAYLEKHAEVHASDEAVGFFERERDLAKATLTNLHMQMSAFRQENEGGDLNLKRRLINEELIEAEQKLRTLEDVAASGTDALHGTSILDNPHNASSFQLLTGLRLDLAQARTQYTESSKEVQSLLNRIEVAEEALLDQLRRNKEYYGRKVKDLREELRGTEMKRSQYEGLVSAIDLAEADFKEYSLKAEEERINQSMFASKMVSVRRISDATTPPKPWFPNRFVLAFLGFVLGVPAAIAVALARAYFYSRISSVEDVENELGTPVLATVPRLSVRELSRGLPESVVRSARVVYAAADRAGAGVLHLASATEREGSATLAAAVATVAAAEANREVVLALTAPGQAPLAAIEECQVMDLSDRAFDEQRVVVTEAANAGKFIVLSGGPLARDNGGIHAAMADASVFVVSGAGIHIEVARRGLQVMERYSPAVLGAVLTQRVDPIPRMFYGRV